MSSATTSPPNAAWPERFRDVDHVEDVMTTPSAALISDLARVSGDLIILGVGGKIGPTLARLARRAAPGKRVVGVARFSEPGLRDRLGGWGVACVEADLLDRPQSAAPTELAKGVWLAG